MARSESARRKAHPSSCGSISVLTARARSGYRIIPHTSEIGLALAGRDLAGLYGSAARGLLAVYGLRKPRGPAEVSAELELSAQTPEELLVDWINELVFRVGTEHWAPRRIAFAAAEERRLKASLSGERISGELAVEVKAATYHGLEVKRARGRWTATVILDV